METDEQLRIGVLGAARITPMALVSPAKAVPGVVVAAVAARDRARGEAFAAKRGIERVLGSYDELIDDPDIDAIYNPLPNSFHFEWTERALRAGKHVLCEKPFMSNSEEAERIAEVARETGLQVMEAFHYRYHPVARRMIEIVRSGELGDIQRIETNMCVPLLEPGNIRFRFDLSGGATMDTGAYAIHMLRHLAGEEPVVVQAEARLLSDQIDRWMTAEFRFGNGAVGRMTCALLSSTLLKIGCRVVGSHGEMRVFNPVMPFVYHHVRVQTGGRWRTERLSRDKTYLHQLHAFADCVRTGEPPITDIDDAVANMRVIDSVYEAAGLAVRAKPMADDSDRASRAAQ